MGDICLELSLRSVDLWFRIGCRVSGLGLCPESFLQGFASAKPLTAGFSENPSHLEKVAYEPPIRLEPGREDQIGATGIKP